MLADKVIQTLANSDKKIIFFFDTDSSKKEELATIEEAGIKVIEVNRNYFELKFKLDKEWNDCKIVLYHAFAKPEGKKIRKYPLLDLLAANIELKLDEVSEFISEFKLPESSINRSLIDKYFKILKIKSNKRKLANILDPDYFNEDSLKRGIISILLDFNSVEDKFNCMNKWLILTLDENKFSKVNKALKEYGLDTIIIKWFNVLLDTKEDNLSIDSATNWIIKLKYNILTANVTKISSDDTYSTLKIKRAADTFKVLKFFDIWQKQQSNHPLIEKIFSGFGKIINTLSILKWYGTENEYEYYSEEMIENILRILYTEVEVNTLQTKEESIRWRKKENTSEYIKNQIEFLYHASSMFAILESYNSFRFNSAEEYIKEYTTELHKVDYHYRKAVIAFDKVRDHLEEFEGIALPVFAKLNNKYDRFLIEYNSEWQKLLEEKDFNFHNIDCNKQFNFYQDNLGKVDYKMAVIVSDAFRYELGYELYNDLLADSKNNLTIQPCLASIPSYTNLGMSNLLPNKGITIEKGEQDLVFKINGKPTNSQNRQAILQDNVRESVTIDYAEIIKFDRDTGRQFFIKNKLVYIYHDWMDAIGDKKKTEHETFEETAKVVGQIKRLIKKIHGWNILHVLVTADHGFLFNYNELKESDKETIPKTKGYSKDNSRFVIGEKFENEKDGYIFDMKNTTNCETDLKIAIPRAINRYRRQGNIGLQFVHGGASIQEIITPVIKYYKQKKETTETVTFRRIDNTNKITTGNIKVALLQNEPVSNVLKSLDIVIGLFNDNGELVSNAVELSCNATSANPKERVFEVILTLNSLGSKASFCHLKAYNLKDKLNPILNDLLTISTLMEMDF
ncbi:BREX-1 system phosphatase PglZ type A [Yeosuana sp.]|uniref:BREX-1 system phosphatase PglZ type A n=1 Tax=Yeosuana sp. TaxID=2529388 RepID=UPI004049E457